MTFCLESEPYTPCNSNMDASFYIENFAATLLRILHTNERTIRMSHDRTRMHLLLTHYFADTVNGNGIHTMF